MGKYMKKRRVLGEKLPAMEVSKSQLGVRTRAMERKRNHGREHHAICVDNEDAEPARSAPTMQVSYLELRNRRLEKVMDCSGASSRAPSIHNSTVASEYRRLSHLADSDVIVDNSMKWAQSESRLTHSEEVPFSMKLRNSNFTGCLSSDENMCFAFCRDRDQLHSCLRTSVKHLLTSGNNVRGRNAPSVAHSRSNSRSNSTTREFSRGILTRNQRKQQTQSDCMDVESSSGRNGNTTHNSSSNAEFETSYGESPIPEVCSGKGRIIRESTPSSYAREAAVPTSMLQLCDLQYGTQSQHVPISPMDMEIEDFFTQAEMREQRRFIEKYNFDPVDETPLPGRFAWVNLQPSV